LASNTFFMSVLSWISGYDEDNAARAAAADAELRRLNQDRYGRDYVNADDYLGQEAALGAIEESFDEGWQEGQQNVSGFIGGTIKRIVADPLRAVIGGLPWWLWALALAALAFYLWPLIRLLLRRTVQ